MDRETTYVNVITGGHPPSGAIPLYCDTDRRVIDLALQTVGLVEPEDTRVVRIHNTLDVAEILASEAYSAEVKKRPDLTMVGPPGEMAFDQNGDLLPF
jgi:hypothetical protein